MLAGCMDDDGCDIKVNDITPPEAAPTQSPVANAHGWNNSDVTVTWDWFDAGVGIDERELHGLQHLVRRRLSAQSRGDLQRLIRQ